MTKAQEVIGALFVGSATHYEDCPVCDRRFIGRRFVANRFEWYCSCGWTQLVNPE